MADDHDDEEGDGIQVSVRIRPLNAKEVSADQTMGWEFNDTAILETSAAGTKTYTYDHVFAPAITNEAVYECVGKPILQKAMNGFNGCIFSYGQTGSGKTWSMMGCPEDPGITKRCVDDIFKHIEQETRRNANIQFTLKVSYLEVYNEEINDLLNDDHDKGRNLRITSDDPNKGGVQIGGLTERQCDNASDILGVIEQGEKNRSYGATEMNANSSRSHTLYRLYIESSEEVEVDAGGASEFRSVGATNSGGGPTTKPVVKTSYLNLVDLAGSERQKSTGAKGSQLKEGANINKSLLTLGSVIQKLGEQSKAAESGSKISKKGNFIPYRDSKLTRILKQSLGGNSVTSILCAMTAAPMYHEETVSTLKFGQLCKAIKNKPKSNSTVDDKVLLKQYRNQISALRDEMTGKDTILTETKAEVVNLQKQLEQAEADAKAAEEAAKVDDAARIRLEQEQQKVERQKKRADDLEIKIKQEKASARAEAEAQYNARLNVERKKLEEEKGEMNATLEQNYYEMEEVRIKESKLTVRDDELNDREHRLKIMESKQEQEQAELTKRFNALDEMHSELMQIRYEIKKQFKEWDMMRNNLQNEEKRQRLHQQELETKEVELGEREERTKALEKDTHEKLEKAKAQVEEAEKKDKHSDDRQKKLSSAEEKLKAEKEELEVRTKETESLSFQLMNRDAEAERTDANLKKREETIKALTETYESNHRTLQTMQKTVNDQAEKRAIREKRVLKMEQETKAKAKETEKRSERLKLDLESTVEEKAKVEELRAKLEGELAEVRNQQEMLDSKESELVEREEKALDMEQRNQDVEMKEADIKMRQATVRQEEDEFMRIKATVINGKNARELAEMTDLLDETSSHVKRLQAEKADILRQKNEKEEEAQILASELDKVKYALDQEGKLVDFMPRMLDGIDARDARSDDIHEEAATLQKSLYQNISQTESLLRFTLMAHDRRPVSSQMDQDADISPNEAMSPGSAIPFDILSDMRTVIQNFDQDERSTPQKKTNQSLHRLKRFVAQASHGAHGSSMRPSDDEAKQNSDRSPRDGVFLHQRQNPDSKNESAGPVRRGGVANAPPPVPSSRGFAKTRRQNTPSKSNTPPVPTAAANNRAGTRQRGTYSSVPVASVSLDLSDFSSPSRTSGNKGGSGSGATMRRSGGGR